jgi:hypothetical protein
MNYDHKSVGGGYLEIMCVWTEFLIPKIRPWLGQCWDLVNYDSIGNLTFSRSGYVMSLFHLYR